MAPTHGFQVWTPQSFLVQPMEQDHGENNQPMPSIDSLVLALQRERSKNVELRKQLKVLQNQNLIFSCSIGTEITHQRKQVKLRIV